MSKELEALKVWYAVKKYMNLYHHMSIKENIDVKTVEGMPVDIIEKALKALEIIKKKKVDTYLLALTKNVNQYNRLFEEHLISLCRLLTQEEFDLLKEVLK
jgi:hypothetical protein